jgi:predicted acylesterase/phospholipase RssA
MNTKRALLISGGGAWGAFGGGTLARINGDFDTVVGVSTGSLLAPLTALKEWDLLKAGYTSVTNKSVFDKKWYRPLPLKPDGKLRKIPIIMSLILGEKTICTSNALRKTIDGFFPENFFEELKQQNKEILVGTQNFAQIPSKIHYFSSMIETFENFKDWMW